MRSNFSYLPTPPRPGSTLQAYLLGQVDFEALLAVQQRLVYEVAGNRDQAVLILCEHPPLITVGREGSRAHILYELDELRSRELTVRWVNRGGGCWLHAPGQLAIYAVLPLDRLGLGLQAYVRRLETVARAVLADFYVPSHLHASHAGVWVGNRPLAPIGVAVRHWVSYYGAIFNVHPDLRPFRWVRLGHADAGPMTSLERERRGPLRPALVRERFLEHFAAQFGFARTTLFFEHPQLTAARRLVARDHSSV
ncbi:MAG: lipoyl(octanoyl) transferase LipB [Gemmataceae bacterium]|nr:lipoyl(octanoyl) transferase LipB [Gemmataceae bacterium]MDW8266616.1 lipoyl(octanoyl) transferase LipB [Gemmataceae bacterium]